MKIPTWDGERLLKLFRLVKEGNEIIAMLQELRYIHPDLADAMISDIVAKQGEFSLELENYKLPNESK
jgi:hypothetical protein